MRHWATPMRDRQSTRTLERQRTAREGSTVPRTRGMTGGRAVLVAGALLALSCPAAGVTAVRSGRAPATAIADAVDTSGVLDLRTAGITQHAGSLVFAFSTRRPFRIVGLAARAHRTVCLEIGPRGHPSRAVRLCLTGRPGAHALYRSPAEPGGPRARFVTARLTRPSPREATVRFAFADAGLRRGRVDWAASSVCVHGSGCTAASPCRDRAPDRGAVAGRIDAYRVSGCVASGP